MDGAGDENGERLDEDAPPDPLGVSPVPDPCQGVMAARAGAGEGPPSPLGPRSRGEAVPVAGAAAPGARRATASRSSSRETAFPTAAWAEPGASPSSPTTTPPATAALSRWRARSRG